MSVFKFFVVAVQMPKSASLNSPTTVFLIDFTESKLDLIEKIFKSYSN